LEPRSSKLSKPDLFAFASAVGMAYCEKEPFELPRCELLSLDAERSLSMPPFPLLVGLGDHDVWVWL